VDLSWNELPNATDEVSAVHTLEVIAVNVAGQEVLVDAVHVTGDAAGAALSVEYAPFSLGENEQGSFSVDLDALSIDLAQMQTSGVLVVEVSLFRNDGSTLGRTSTPPIYFHPNEAATAFEVYGEQVMKEQHAAGDFAGAALDGDPPNPRLRRVMQGNFEIPGGAE
jgi:hypothetical protein